MKREHVKALRICSIVIFGVYIIFLTYFLFFAESTGRTFQGRDYNYNLVLFREIRRFIVYHRELGLMTVLLNLGGNIVAFIPFGVILPVLHRKFRSFFFMTFMTLEFSLLVEIIQLIFKVGSFDVDDLLLNTIGGMSGYLIFAIMNKIRRNRYEKTP